MELVSGAKVLSLLVCIYMNEFYGTIYDILLH